MKDTEFYCALDRVADWLIVIGAIVVAGMVGLATWVLFFGRP